MDFRDQIKLHSDRIVKLRDNICGEEATKTAFILPFIQILGYDVFNPLEVVPEFTCDVGTKKGEKIDYAIFNDKKPVILIECKHCGCDLDEAHDNQLRRYFMAASAKFGILTNGIVYRFYASLDTMNKMDEKPFLEVDLLNIKGGQVEELKKFCKEGFDVDNILSAANDLKYTGALRNLIGKEFTNPSPELVKFFAKQVYDGQMTAKAVDQFTAIIRRSFQSYISDMVSDRLNTALNAEAVKSEGKDVAIMSDEKEVVTTEEELQAFYIVKSILRSSIPADRITYRDALSYFTVILDDNNRKLICRLYLNSPTNKILAFMGDDKKEVRYKIGTIDEIYDYADQINANAHKFIDTK